MTELYHESINRRSFLDEIILAETSFESVNNVWLYRVTKLIYDQDPYTGETVISAANGENTMIDNTLRYLFNYDSSNVVGKKQHGLSFGQSIFASLAYDRGACVFEYIVNPGYDGYTDRPSYFYRIALNKDQVRQHTDASNFVIHPINQVVHLLTSGYHYHPWSKKVNDPSLIDSFNDDLTKYAASHGGDDYTKTTVKSGSFLELSRNISSLLSESELFAVKGEVPSEENYSFWETLKSNHKEYAEALDETLKAQRN